MGSKQGSMPRTDLNGVTRRTLLRQTGKAGMGVSLLSPVLGVLAACGSSTSDGPKGAERQIDALRWALETAPQSLDTFKEVSIDSWVVQYTMSEGLVGYSPSLELVPRVAAKVANPSPTKYVYTLRDGVQFHDGTAMTVDDVIYSIERHVGKKSGSQVIVLNGIEGVEQTAESEITITLGEPNAVFEYGLVLAPIIPKAFAEERGEKLGAQGGVNWLGTGPYKLATFGNDSIVIERNDAYWGEKPAAKKATFSFISDPQTRQIAVRSGQIDGTFSVPVSDVAQWERLPETTVEKASGLGVTFLSFNVETEPWSDVHVRRAFAHALNLEGIVKAILKGNAQPANAMVAPAQWGGIVPRAQVASLYESLPAYPYDLDAAKAELARSSRPSGFSASIEVPDWSDPYGTDAMLAFAADLEKIGVKLEVKSVPANQWDERVLGAHEDLGLEMMGWGPDYPDPANYLALSYPSANAGPNNYNTANFKDPRVDKLLKEQALTTDDATRARALSDVLRISQEELPYLNLWWSEVCAATGGGFGIDDFNAFYYFGWIQNVKKSA